MSIKFYHNNAWRELTGQKIRYGNQWMELHSEDRMYLDGEWHYLDAGYELYVREIDYKPFVRVGDRANWVYVRAISSHGCVALNNRGEAYAIEVDGYLTVKIADGVVRVTNCCLIFADGRFVTYGAYFQRKRLPQVSISAISTRNDIVRDGQLALSTTGEMFEFSWATWDYTKKFGEKSNWVALQEGSFSNDITTTLGQNYAIALDSDGKIFTINKYRRFEEVVAPCQFIWFGRVHHNSPSYTLNLVLSTTGDLYSIGDGVNKVDGTGSPWKAAATGSSSDAYAIDEAGRLYRVYAENIAYYYGGKCKQVDTGGLYLVDIAVASTSIFGIARVTNR